MNRKYLDEIGVSDRPDTWCENEEDPREERWKIERETYGFDSRETWSLDFSFYLWLYERVKMYRDIAIDVVDLTFHNFDYENEKYSQLELIDLLLQKLEFRLSSDYNDFDEAHVKESYKIAEIWGLILPAMWW